MSEGGLNRVLHREGVPRTSSGIRAYPSQRSIGGGDCVQEEAENLEFSVRESAPNSGSDKAARCTNPGKIHVYSKLMDSKTLHDSTSTSKIAHGAHTCL